MDNHLDLLKKWVEELVEEKIDFTQQIEYPTLLGLKIITNKTFQKLQRELKI